MFVILGWLHWELLPQRLSVTFLETWICSSSAVSSSYIARYDYLLLSLYSSDNVGPVTSSVFIIISIWLL